MADGQGYRWRVLAGKPAALLTCLPGATADAVSVEQCRVVGALLARLHLAAADMPDALPNPCGAAWRQRVGESLLPLVDAEERFILADELAFQSAQDWSALPRGVIHADLFRDNVLWDASGQLSGVSGQLVQNITAWPGNSCIVNVSHNTGESWLAFP